MRNRLFKLILVAVAAAGGVAFWQRRNETPPLDPGASTRLRPSEPFMDPVAEPLVSGDAADVDAAAEDVTDDSTSEPEPAAESASDPDPSEREASIRPAEIDTSELPVIGEGSNQAPLPEPPHRPFTTAPEGPADDLKRISGIGPKLEQTLNEEGITTFAQLAALDDAEVNALQARLGGVAGRVRRENWVDQAADLVG